MKRFMLVATMLAGMVGATHGATFWVNVANYDPATGTTRADIDPHDVGKTPELGFGTLAHAANWTGEAGTVFKVLPGVYDQGDINGYRLYAKEGITWIAVAGPERTFVVGKASEGEGSDEFGNGPGQIRCVKALANSFVQGFTITGGRSRNINDSDIGYGGGVHAKNAPSARIVDCIISNNSAWASAAVYMGTYVNCRFFENKTLNHCAVGSDAGFVNCVFKDNYGYHDARGSRILLNCTFGRHIPRTGSAAEREDCGVVNFAGPAVNCIFVHRGDLAYTSSSEAAKRYATNCLYVSTFPHGGNLIGCQQMTEAGLKLDADYKPAKDSPAVGFGVTEHFTAEYLAYATIDGTPRVLNAGAIDAGAYEYDWRTDYAAAIGGGVTVTDASPGVTLDGDGRVALPDGATLTGELAAPAERSKCTYTATAETGGALTGLFANGADPTKTLDAFELEDGTETRSFIERKDVPLCFELGYAGEGYGTLFDFAREDASTGLTLLLR